MSINRGIFAAADGGIQTGGGSDPESNMGADGCPNGGTRERSSRVPVVVAMRAPARRVVRGH